MVKDMFGFFMRENVFSPLHFSPYFPRVLGLIFALVQENVVRTTAEVAATVLAKTELPQATTEQVCTTES